MADSDKKKLDTSLQGVHKRKVGVIKGTDECPGPAVFQDLISTEFI